MEQPPQEKNIHRLFEVGVVLKGINAALELIAGAFLLFTPVVNDLVLAMAQNELIEDPNDFFATHIRSFLLANPHVQVYAGVYLLAEGVVKAVLVVGLLRNKLWAYPAALSVLSLLILFQGVTFFMHTSYSVPLLVLILFDIVLVGLIYHEYRVVSKNRRQA